MTAAPRSPRGHGIRTRVAEAASVLQHGGLVAFPTETVYGLGADAANPDAIAKVFAAKGRPTGHPLIVHVAGLAGLVRSATVVPPAARRLADALWPGPLTLIVERSDKVHPAATGGLATVGVRCPGHPVALELLEAFGGGIAAPSANRFGRVSPTTASHVRAELGDVVDVVVDGGPSRIGVESTIVDCTRTIPNVLRLGAIGLEQLVEAQHGPVTELAASTVAAPGTLDAHYAPSARVVLVASTADLDAAVSDARGDVAVLAPTGTAAGAAPLLDAGPDATSYAARLYDLLRTADARGVGTVVALAPAGDEPLAAAVLDRLTRAAASR